MFETGKVYHGFLFTEKKNVPEINADVYIAKHTKSGARLMYVASKDDNKVFSIAFKTVPQDDTGVMHILEHSVLNGSDKYPVREPFVELLKGSMQTFLNAFTYPDKTMYPVASRNEKDFENLMGVYLDAVFHPAIYHKKEIFLQEGWHFEPAENGKDECFRGVVYNEMKGEMSSEDSLLTEHLQNTLFPDVCYNKNSGGAPEAIPSLTYEQFIETHKRFYHPENSYIYLYGDMDVDKKLELLDAGYLSHYERIDKKVKIGEQPDRGELRFTGKYSSNEKPKGATHYALGFKVGKFDEKKKLYGISILLDSIASNNESPLKKALLEKGVCEECWAYLEDQIMNPYVCIALKRCSDDEEKVLDTVKEALAEIAERGIDKSVLEASLNTLEFRLREADFGNMPSGLVYCQSAMASWLYGGDPTEPLRYEEVLKSLREDAKGDYFENLIREYLLSPKHYAIVKLLPSDTFSAEKDEAERKRVAAYREKIGEAGMEAARRELESLRAAQNAEDTKEALETIPVLSVSDVERTIPKIPSEDRQIENIRVRYHNIATKKILYATLFFNLGDMPEDNLQYAALAARLFGIVATKKKSASEVITALKINTGSFGAAVAAYSPIDNNKNVSVRLRVSFSALEENIEKAVELVGEVLTESRFDDVGEIKKILAQEKMGRELWMARNGHQAAMGRVYSYFSAADVIAQKISGIDYYLFIKELSGIFDEKCAQRLSDAMEGAINSDNLILSVTGGEEIYDKVKENISRLGLKEGIRSDKTFTAQPEVKDEGIAVSTDVSYTAKGGNSGKTASGKLLVLAQIMTYDYLWNTIRAKGGAYGTGLVTNLSGDVIFYSYRDPNLKDTLDAFDASYDYLKSFAPDEREMTKHIIGAIAASDKPKSPAVQAATSDRDFFCRVSHALREKVRGEMLETTAEDIRELAEIVRGICDENMYCVFSSKAKIDKNEKIFKSTWSVS